MHFSCEACMPLQGGSWKEEWFLPVAALSTLRLQCQTCKLLHDGISAILGSGFISLFSDVGFPHRDEGDDGTLRINIYPPEFGNIWSSVRVCRLRIFTAPGKVSHFITATLPVTTLASCLTRVLQRVQDSLENYRRSTAY